MNRPQFRSNIPIPQSRAAKWLWLRDMKKGQSAFVPGIKRTTLSGILAYYKPLKFTTRQIIEGGVEGIRVWRVK